ncbi:MAG: peptidylprolyl isomerase [Romboutsia sp.]|nr:peptidylprolyl isomerase [Romboutsia sp.]
MSNNKIYKKISTSKKLALIVITSASITTVSFIITNYFLNKNYILNVAATKISSDEFNEILASRRYVLSKLNSNNDILNNDSYNKEIIDDLKKSLIQDEVIYQISVNENIKVTEKEILNELKSFEELIGNNDDYSKYLKSNNVSTDTIKKYIEKDLISKKYIDKLLRKTEISDEEIKEYYEKNKFNLFTLDEVKVSHILLKTIDSNKNSISDDRKVTLKNKINDILTRIKSGEDFTTLAINFSEDEGSSSIGGDLGYFSYGVMDETFENIAFNTNVGEVSDVFETPFGYHVLKVTDKRTRTLTLEDSYSLILEMLKMEKVEKQINELIKKYPVDIYR